MLVCSAITQAQYVVLVNGNATKVDLDGSDVVALHEELPRYMRGFEKAPYDGFMKTMPLSNIEDIIVAEDSGDIIYENDPSLPPNALYFDPDLATLTKSTIAALKNYATMIKESNSKSVILKSWYKLGDINSQELISNRLEACKQYLEINGIQGSLIFTSFTASKNATDYVSINYQ